MGNQGAQPKPKYNPFHRKGRKAEAQDRPKGKGKGQGPVKMDLPEGVLKADVTKALTEILRPLLVVLAMAALVRGFRDHGPPAVTLAGVVLNRVGSERHRALLAEALAAISVPLLGVLPHHTSLDLPSRHLGLLPPQELDDLGERQRLWAGLAGDHGWLATRVAYP
jgi:hypothetical protein